ncbi:MAG: PAS domain S-box protein [Thermoleophilaceae bacterium]
MRDEAVDKLLVLAPDPTLVVDRGLRIAAACERTGRLFGRSADELVGLALETVVAPDGVLDPEEKLFARRPDGSEVPIEISVRVVEGRDERVLAVAIRDVTERRRRAATLREEGERFRRLFEDGPVAMVLAEEDMRLSEVNDAFCELTGYRREELTGLTLADITHPDDVDVSLRLAQRTFAGELPSFSVDKRYVRKGGDVVWAEVTVSAIRDEDGRPLKGLGVMRDITERREALKRAHAELERLARDRDRILEFAGEGIYHVDGSGRITFANPAAEAMLGWPAEALIGKPAHEMLHHTRADGTRYPRAECPLHDDPEHAVEHITDDVFWRRDGTSFHVQYTSAPVREPGGGAVVVFADVSDRVRMEAELRESRQRAGRERMQVAEAERARWARELHDETLQGLAAVHVLLSSGLRALSDDDRRGRMRLAQEQIEGEMEKLRGLISDLRPAALDELGLEASVRDLAARVQTVYGIEVETSVALPARDGEAYRIAPDVETAAYRIAQECLSNAAKHAGATRVHVELAQDGDVLHVRVRDDGRGFDAAADASGFGLRSMRERVDLLKGRLTVRSAAEDGTAVVAALPVAGAPAEGGDGAPAGALAVQDWAETSSAPTSPRSIA